MSFRKAIEAGKEPRRKRGERVSPSCKHGGDCPWCIGNRTYRTQKLLKKTQEQLNQEIS